MLGTLFTYHVSRGRVVFGKTNTMIRIKPLDLCKQFAYFENIIDAIYPLLYRFMKYIRRRYVKWLTLEYTNAHFKVTNLLRAGSNLSLLYDFTSKKSQTIFDVVPSRYVSTCKVYEAHEINPNVLRFPDE